MPAQPWDGFGRIREGDRTVSRGDWISIGVVAFFALLLIVVMWRVSVQPRTRGWRLGLYFERDLNDEDPTEARTQIWPAQKEALDE